MTLVASGVAIGLDVYLERLTALDNEFVTLQKRALKDQESNANRQGDIAANWNGLKARFFAPGKLPDPLSFAAKVQAALQGAGITIAESRVSESSAGAQWLQYRVSGPIESWFQFLGTLRSRDGRTLFRSFSLVKKDGASYAIVFEVGHAILP
jgi:hypothetical protein